MKKRIGLFLALLASCVIASSTGARRQSGPPPPTIVAMEEASGATTDVYPDTAHDMRITFQMPSPAPAGGGGGYTGTTTGTTGTGTTGTTTGGTTGGDGTTYTPGTTFYVFAVNHACVQSLADISTPVTPYEATLYLGAGSTDGVDVEMLNPVSPGDQCLLRISPSSQTVIAYWASYTPVTKVVTVGGVSTTSYGYYVGIVATTYAVSRTTATAVAIDSRKAFGQPDLGGALPGDANAPAANVNFNGWTYKGGLFAGNADFLSASDLSGTAWTELYATLPSTTHPVFETATLLALGAPSQFTTVANLTAYAASAGSTDLTTATWSTAWTLSSTDSSSAIDFTPYAAPEYANFEFAGEGASGMIAVVPTTVTSGVSMWEYFASSSYITSLTATGSSLLSSPPFSDPLPRFWIADQTAPQAGYIFTDPPGF